MKLRQTLFTLIVVIAALLATAAITGLAFASATDDPSKRVQIVGGGLEFVAVTPPADKCGKQKDGEAIRLRVTSVREVVLLTTTARDFFSNRFRFEEATRADYDEQFAASPEWKLPRCSSAVVMRLKLTPMEASA